MASDARLQPDLVMSDTEGPSQQDLGSKKEMFQALIKKGREAVSSGSHAAAADIYSQLLALDPANAVLYSNRSAILAHLGRWQEALADAHSALQIAPNWTKGYYRAGKALCGLGDWVGALKAFAAGLAQEPANSQLLSALVSAAGASDLRRRFGEAYEELARLGLQRSPFVLVSVVGQELHSAGKSRQAAEVLECALRIGTTSLKLKQSVLSSLSSAYWSLGERERALACMQADLSVAAQLGDPAGQAEAQGNLGMVYFALGKEAEALSSYREQLSLAQRLGNEGMARGALANIAAVLLDLGKSEAALEAHHEALNMLQKDRASHQSDGHSVEMGRQLEGLGRVHLARADLEAAEDCFHRVRGIAQHRGDKAMEAKAMMGLGDLAERRGRTAAALTLFQSGAAFSEAAALPLHSQLHSEVIFMDIGLINQGYSHFCSLAIFPGLMKGLKP